MKPLHIIYIFILMFASYAMSGCSDSERVNTFNEIETRIGNDPKTAVRFVDSLNADIGWKDGMNAAERARFDLLRVKSADKAYVRHTSDSLIRSVLGYYEKHTRSEQYPEALYYGGRVYSDLGDSPTALRYFQQALDALPEKGNEELMAKVLSQTARLMNRMRMYDEALKYLDEAIRIESQLNDTSSLAYDYELSGALLLHADSLNRAKEQFGKALALCRPETALQARQYTYLAAAEYKSGNIGEAVRLISGMPDRITGTYRTTSMGYAAMIYLEAHQYDSARYYAERILYEKDPRNRKIAYSILLSPHVKEMLPPDSVENYYVRYGEEVSEFAENNNREACVFSNAIYNYGIHDRRRQQAEDDKKTYAIAGLCLLLAVLGLCLTVAVIRQRNNRNKLDLYEALENIRTLRSLLVSAHSEKEAEDNGMETECKPVTDNDGNQNKETAPDNTTGPEFLSDNEKSCLDMTSVCADVETEDERLRLILRKELLGLITVSSKYTRPSKNYIVPERIAKSETYKDVCRSLETGKALPPDATIWQDLKKLAGEVWPGLQDRLNMLAGSRIKEKDYRLCLLIKLGFSPTDITVLSGRTKGTISSRRARLCKEILGENAGANGFDIVILSL